MRGLLALVPLSLVALHAQTTQTLEDFSCATATLIAGNPTTVHCSVPHGLTNGMRVLLWGATGGNWANITTQARAELRQSMNATTTSPMLVNDTSFFPQTGQFNVLIASK